jgi:hypothetical protein
VKASFWLTQFFKSVAPALLAAYLSALKFLIERISKTVVLSGKRSNLGKRVTKSFLVHLSMVSFSFYIPIISNLSSPLFCSRFSDGSKSVMINNRSEVCGGALWTFYAVYSTLLLFFYIVLFPCLLLWMVFSQSSLLEDPEIANVVLMVTGSYKPRFFFWDIVKMVERSAFVLLPLIATGDAASNGARVVLSVGIIGVYSILEILIDPYKRKSSQLFSSR